MISRNKLNIRIMQENMPGEIFFENSKEKNNLNKIAKNDSIKIPLSIQGKKQENIEKINYDELSFSQALQKDNRNFFNILISLFYLKLDIIQIVFFPKEFSHKSLTLSLYLFDILLDLTINALLFSDDIISQKYYNNGKLKIIILYILSLISNIICNFILNLTEMLINYYEILNTIIHEIKEPKQFYKIFIKISRIIKLKIIIFYSILLLIGLFCNYYLFIFCSIYKKIQKNLFINYIIGLIWPFCYTFSLCLLIAILRKISLKKRIKRLYIISRFIDEKF